MDVLGPLYAPPGPWCRVRRVMSLAQSCMSKHPAKVLFTRHKELQRRIREAVHSRRYDAVLINGSDMLWSLDELPGEIPTILIAHNLEHRLLAQQLFLHPFLASLLEHEVRKHRHYELEALHRVDGVIFVSGSEMDWTMRRVPGLRALHVPPLFSSVPVSRTSEARGPLRLGYLADCAWWPNRQNWSWFIEQVLPSVHRPVQVHAFGRQSEQLPFRDRVVLHGRVPDLAAVWNHVDIMICPIRVGAGTSIKVAESLHHRIPVLATPQAVNGFECSSGPGLVIMDHAQDWIRFLDSDDADCLAGQVPSGDLCEQFAVDRHEGQLKFFICNVLRDPTPNMRADRFLQITSVHA